MILFHASPGKEEGLLAGIEAELGASVPVVGGSAADSSVSGDWQLCWDEAVAQDGIGLAVLYPDCQLAFQFHSGYVPAEFSGEITACNGREVLTIDHQPAAEVYARWCGREQPWPVGRFCGRPRSPRWLVRWEHWMAFLTTNSPILKL